MTRYLLDTDPCIYALEHKHGVLDHLSVITESELRFGVDLLGRRA